MVTRFSALRRHPLPLFLCLQAVLLFWRLDLLPVWGDEHHTLITAAKPVWKICQDLAGEYHPPGYFLLMHYLTRLPWPGSQITEVRAWSVTWMLLATVLAYFLWVRRLEIADRWWFLGLWAFSPFLLLYARMGRSYTMQLFFALLAIYCAVEFVEDPRHKRRLALYSGAAAVLLYIHYLPGIAIATAVAIVLAWKALRNRDRSVALALVASNGLIALLYLPWAGQLILALMQIAHDTVYKAGGSWWWEHLLRLAYSFVALIFGETPPLWVVGVGAVLSPIILWLLWKGIRQAPAWLPLVLLAGLTAYFGMAEGVAFSFVPARLMFVFPFLLLLLLLGKTKHPRLGTAACAALLLLAAGSIRSYARKEDFLNKGYLIPTDDIAARVKQNSSRNETVVLIDYYGLDPYPFADRLRRDLRVWIVRGPAAAVRLRSATGEGRAKTIWFVRSPHDVSPNGLNDLLERELSERYEIRRHLFLPYSDVDRLAMRVLGWRQRPTHAFEALEMHQVR